MRPCLHHDGVKSNSINANHLYSCSLAVLVLRAQQFSAVCAARTIVSTGRSSTEVLALLWMSCEYGQRCGRFSAICCEACTKLCKKEKYTDVCAVQQSVAVDQALELTVIVSGPYRVMLTLLYRTATAVQNSNTRAARPHLGACICQPQNLLTQQSLNSVAAIAAAAVGQAPTTQSRYNQL